MFPKKGSGFGRNGQIYSDTCLLASCQPCPPVLFRVVYSLSITFKFSLDLTFISKSLTWAFKFKLLYWLLIIRFSFRCLALNINLKPWYKNSILFLRMKIICYNCYLKIGVLVIKSYEHFLTYTNETWTTFVQKQIVYN